MLNHDPTAKTHSRLGFLLIMALALHTAIILGVGFFLKAPKARPAKRIDITLSHYHEDKPVNDADFLAQSNQSASGTESAKKEMTTTEAPLISSSLNTPVQTVLLETMARTNEAKNLITTTANSNTVSTMVQTSPDIDSLDATGKDSIEQKQLEIAALKAKLDQQKQAYARLPKTRKLSSVATRSAADAAYLYQWQQRIELIGNQYYPTEARKGGLYGELQMLVSINQQGKLMSAKILKSSGNPILDNSALRIVKLASPYAPIPPTVLKGANVLEIVRTWRFQKNRFSQSL